ncbi:MAG TPA: hypothetical protein VJ793_10485 [Anaerolineae bacterium]|nr:hypothetical protein [Anaerolineae bacterium]
MPRVESQDSPPRLGGILQLRLVVLSAPLDFIDVDGIESQFPQGDGQPFPNVLVE